MDFYVAPFNDYFPTLGPHLETRKALQNHPSTDAARRPEGSADQRLDVSSRRGWIVPIERDESIEAHGSAENDVRKPG